MRLPVSNEIFFIMEYFFYTNSKSKVYKEFASKSMIYDFYANFYLKFIWN
jgi:hypothetical protein